MDFEIGIYSVVSVVFEIGIYNKHIMRGGGVLSGRIEPIRDTIKTVFKNFGDKRHRAKEEDPWHWLKNTLTKKELGHIKCNYFRKGTLGIGVDSSSWLYYFNLKKVELLSRLSKQSKKIKDIHLYLGESE